MHRMTWLPPLFPEDFGNELNSIKAARGELPLQQATVVIYVTFAEVFNSRYQSPDTAAIQSVLARVLGHIKWGFRGLCGYWRGWMVL